MSRHCHDRPQHQHDGHQIHHHGHHMSIDPDRCAPNCDDQLPLISRVGRGLTGDSYRVSIKKDTCDTTILQGQSFDASTREWREPDWISDNINGGRLTYTYNLMPFTVPQMFTITFHYFRPPNPSTTLPDTELPGIPGTNHHHNGPHPAEGRCEWSFTTPPIPYLWDVDDNDEPNIDQVIGSGIANLYVREGVDADWVDMERRGDPVDLPEFEDNTGRWGQLNWPRSTAGPWRHNTPNPDELWAATITFGWGGDVELPNLDDIAHILGTRRPTLENLLRNRPTIITPEGDREDGWVDDDGNMLNVGQRFRTLDDHIHFDMGFGRRLLGCPEADSGVSWPATRTLRGLSAGVPDVVWPTNGVHNIPLTVQQATADERPSMGMAAQESSRSVNTIRNYIESIKEYDLRLQDDLNRRVSSLERRVDDVEDNLEQIWQNFPPIKGNLDLVIRRWGVCDAASNSDIRGNFSTSSATLTTSGTVAITVDLTLTRNESGISPGRMMLFNPMVNGQAADGAGADVAMFSLPDTPPGGIWTGTSRPPAGRYTQAEWNRVVAWWAANARNRGREVNIGNADWIGPPDIPVLQKERWSFGTRTIAGRHCFGHRASWVPDRNQWYTVVGVWNLMISSTLDSGMRFTWTSFCQL